MDKLDRIQSKNAELSQLALALGEIGLDPIYVELGELAGIRRDLDLHKRAVPVLVEHLQKDYLDGARAVIASLLCVKSFPSKPANEKQLANEIRPYWDIIENAYVTNKDEPCVTVAGDTELRRPETKTILAHALFQLADKKTMPKLLDLIRDPHNGGSRSYLLIALERRKRQLWVQEFLKELVDDPDLKGEVRELLAHS